MYYVYILKGRDNRFYVGSTEDVGKRIKQHAQGGTKSLKNKAPFDLVRVEEFSSRTEALKREHQIKRYKGGRAFKKLIAGNSGTSLSLV